MHVAQPDHHPLVVDGGFRLSRGSAENGHLPAVDALFRSAIASRGRLTVVRAPVEALCPARPEGAPRHAPGARVLPVELMDP